MNADKTCIATFAPPTVSVPNVVGLTQAAAQNAITAAGLTIGTVTTASSTTVPAGNVISQSPAAGMSVAAGSAVALVVSSGLISIAECPQPQGFWKNYPAAWPVTSLILGSQ